MSEYNYTIPDIPPSNNKYLGRTNRFEYQNDKQMWCAFVDAYCRPRPKQPIKKSLVMLTYYFKDRRKHDPDNFSGKQILDGLVSCRILEDDSFSNIDLKLVGKYDKDNPRTEILIISADCD